MEISVCSPKVTNKGCLPQNDYNKIKESVSPNDINSCKSQNPKRKDTQNYCLVQKAIEQDKGNFHHLLKTYFKPKSPQSWKTKPNTWLSNFDIENVLKQYQTKKNIFIGVAAIDFEKACGYFGFNHCSFKPELNKKYFMVINLSKHNESGTHWVALTMDTHVNSPN